MGENEKSEREEISFQSWRCLDGYWRWSCVGTRKKTQAVCECEREGGREGESEMENCLVPYVNAFEFC